MARSRTIEISALNVAMHEPHSANRYVALMRSAFESRRFVRIGKLHGAMIGTLYEEHSGQPLRGLSGEIYRFLKLDPDEPWFNVATKEAASERDVREIRIPGHLLPHLQRIPFIFRPRIHRLYFVSKDRTDALGAGRAQSLFQQLFDPLIAEGLFPHVEVTVIPDWDTIDRILAIPQLESLAIQLVRPNPDDGDDDQARWLRKLSAQHARRIEMNLFAAKGERLQPDAETVRMAEVAATNGSVVATGRDAEGLPTREATVEKPLRESAAVDSAVETTSHVLSRVADALDAR